MDDDSTTRFEKLEVKLAYHERIYEELSQALADQQGRIERLEARIEGLVHKLETAARAAEEFGEVEGVVD